MSSRLPPDLDRVGDHLVAAAQRDLIARRWRRRMITRTATTGVAALLALAALTPAHLGPAVRGSELLLARTSSFEPPGLPAACDQPRGGRLTLPACAAGEPIRLGRPRRW